jgi:nicotinamide riboside kinase
MVNRPFHIAITGVESTGKTTLANALGVSLQASVASEMAREDLSVRSGKVQLEDLERIGEAQFQACKRAELSAHEMGATFVISDSDATVIRLWGRWAFNAEVPGLSHLDQWPDFTLLCEPNIPWDPDPLRTLPEAHDRKKLHRLYLDELERRPKHTWALIDGLDKKKRLEQGVRAVHAFLAESDVSG